MQTIKKLAWPFLAISFFGFITWIIYLANSNADSIFFRTVHSFTWGDKLGHLFLFGTLTVLLTLATKFKTFELARTKIYVAVVLVLVFVIGEEVSQMFLPNRTFDLIDLAADFAGIAFAAIFCAWLSRWKNLTNPFPKSNS